MTEEDLLSLDHGSFRKVVDVELHGEAPQQVKELLRSEAVVRRWHDALAQILVEVDSQLSSKKSDMDVFQSDCFAKGATGKTEWFAAKRDYDSWRATAVRFKARVIAKKKEAQHLARQKTSMVDAHGLLGNLARAIRSHKDQCEAEDFEPTAADVKLWAWLDHRQVQEIFTSIEPRKYEPK